MRRPVVIVTAAGAVLTAGLLTVPALAATGPGRGTAAATASTCPVTGLPMGAGTGTGIGMGARMGAGMGSGMGYGMGRAGVSADPLAGLTQGTLTSDQKQRLAAMAEEEKLAHDVYVALGTATGDARFSRIAAAETQHLTEIRALLDRYGITDPTAGRADGSFTTASVQQKYRDLVARGSGSTAAAFAVGRDIETADIADLAAAGAGVTATDVTTVYARLSMASQMHLRAFGG